MDQGLRVHQVMEPRGLRSHARARQGALEKATWEVELKGLGAQGHFRGSGFMSFLVSSG